MSSGVSIVIPTWNGLYLLKQTLDATVRAAKGLSIPSEIIVVDNGSMDRTVDVLLDFYEDEVKVFPLDKNYGFGYACDYGVEKSRFDKVFLLNNDLMLAEDTLKILVDEFNYLPPDKFSLSPITNYWNDEEGLTEKVFTSNINFDYSKGDFRQIWGVDIGSRKHLFEGTVKTIYGTGAALLIDREKYLLLDGFDELYSPAYWEDVDLCLRAWKKGWPSYVTDKTKCWHKVSSSTSSNSSWKDFLMERNFYVFYISHCPSESEMEKFLDHLKKSKSAKVSEFLSEKFDMLMDRFKNQNDSNKLTMSEIIKECSHEKLSQGWVSDYYFKVNKGK